MSSILRRWKLLAAGIVLTGLLAACTKPTQRSSVSAGTGSHMVYYLDSSLQTMELQPTDTQSIKIGVGYISGPKERVNFSFSGLPYRVSVPADTGCAPPTDRYIVVSSIRARARLPKVADTVTIRAFTASGAITRKFLLYMIPFREERRNLYGRYTLTSSCSSRDTVTVAPSDPGGIVIRDFSTSIPSLKIEMVLVPGGANSQLQVRSQNTNDYQLSGTATYNYRELIIDYAITRNGTTENCSLHLRKIEE